MQNGRNAKSLSFVINSYNITPSGSNVSTQSKKKSVLDLLEYSGFGDSNESIGLSDYENTSPVSRTQNRGSQKATKLSTQPSNQQGPKGKSTQKKKKNNDIQSLSDGYGFPSETNNHVKKVVTALGKRGKTKKETKKKQKNKRNKKTKESKKKQKRIIAKLNKN